MLFDVWAVMLTIVWSLFRDERAERDTLSARRRDTCRGGHIRNMREFWGVK